MSAPANRAPVAPRGLRRDTAAAYVGISPSKFDEWVSRGIMPKPKKVDHCVIWDRYQLDAAFDSLAGQEQESPGESDWDEAVEWPRSA